MRDPPEHAVSREEPARSEARTGTPGRAASDDRVHAMIASGAALSQVDPVLRARVMRSLQQSYGNARLQRMARQPSAPPRRMLARRVVRTGAGVIATDNRVPAGGIRAVLSNYDIDGDDIKPEHMDFLDREVIPRLVNGTARVRLQGSASHSGEEEHNQGLSERRVDRVIDYLKRHGVLDTQISRAAVGESLATLSVDEAPEDRAVSLLAAPLVAPPPPLPPPPTPLQQILENYQVADDRTAEWSPSAFGLIPIPFAPSRVLTVTEGRLLNNLTRDRGLVGLSDFSDIRDEAFAVSEREYPTPTTFPPHAPTERRARNAWVQNNGHRDAFRHCYWNAILTKEFGENWTRQFATAHEALPGNEAAREAMDLYNNEVGRTIAAANPRADRTELARLVRQAVDGGRLVVVDGHGNLAWSNQVALWDHGDVANVTRPGAIAVPAGTASAH